MKKAISALLVLGILFCVVTDTFARGRKGSKRIGGSGRSGKGSHYRGGR
ncbi:MAG: hypothetical protein JNK65_04595 [Deltaproteobacteria bacterium]|nr:hypothetical protein [Deltaproteobacteria bacterium]